MAAGIINVVSDNNTFNLVGDIGATNARFSLVPLNSSDLTSIKKLPCNDFETFQDAISFYLSSFPEAKNTLSLLCHSRHGPFGVVQASQQSLAYQ